MGYSVLVVLETLLAYEFPNSGYHLNNAKKFVDGVVATGGMVGGLVKAIALVQQLF